MAAVAAAGLAVSSLAWAGSAVANGGSTTAYFTMAQQAGSAVGSQGNSVAVTSNGSRIITGEFSGTAYFPTSDDDSISLTAAGDSDVFVAMMNAEDLYFAWAVNAGGAGTDSGNAVAVTGDDTPIVTGTFSGTATFPTRDDSITLTATSVPPNTDTFVAALNADDSYFAWAVRAGGNADPLNASGVVVTRDDTPIVTGTFSGTATFPTRDDSITLTAGGSLDTFVAALNADDSTFAWVSHIEASPNGDVTGRSIAITTDDTPIMTGRINGSVQFPTRDDSITLTSGSTADVFVAALNADDSTFAWALRAGDQPGNDGYGVTVTGDDTAIITGVFNGSITFGSTTLHSRGGADVFVAAVNPDGSDYAWAIGAGGNTGIDLGYSVAVTRDDSAPVVTGYFDGTALFPKSADETIALTSAGGFDVFVAGVRPDGSGFDWATRAGGSGHDVGYSVAVLGANTPVVTGSFSGSATFPTNTGTAITLPGFPSVISIFLAQLGTSSAPDPGPGPVTVPPSAPLDVTGEAGDASAAITWSAPASAGSFPITTYQAVASPGGQSCLASAPALTCTITGLTNGTTYTAAVRALNGAGWGPYSSASAEFTPRAPVTPSITITGTRGEVRGKPGIVVTGTATGFDEGAILRPWLRFPGQTSYSQGSARILVSDDGSFSWQRRTGKKIYVSIRSMDDTVVSNRIIIRR